MSDGKKPYTLGTMSTSRKVTVRGKGGTILMRKDTIRPLHTDMSGSLSRRRFLGCLVGSATVATPTIAFSASRPKNTKSCDYVLGPVDSPDGNLHSVDAKTDNAVALHHWMITLSPGRDDVLRVRLQFDFANDRLPLPVCRRTSLAVTLLNDRMAVIGSQVHRFVDRRAIAESIGPVAWGSLIYPPTSSIRTSFNFHPKMSRSLAYVRLRFTEMSPVQHDPSAPKGGRYAVFRELQE